MGDKEGDIRELSACSTEEERQQCLAGVLTRHRERLRRMVDIRLPRQLRSRVDPSDVLQEVFVEASCKLDRYLKKPSVPVFIWLRSLAAERLVALQRRHLGARMRDLRKEISINETIQISSEVLAHQLVAPGLSPSEESIRAETRKRLGQALESMDPLDREVLALRHFEQLSSAEASRVLKIQEPAMRQRYVRAVKRLKKILDGLSGKRS